MNKKFVILIFTSIIVMFTPIYTFASENNPCQFQENTNLLYANQNLPVAKKTSQNSTISPQSGYINWRYQYINGVLYKRLYNYSTNKWVGNWIKV